MPASTRKFDGLSVIRVTVRVSNGKQTKYVTKTPEETIRPEKADKNAPAATQQNIEPFKAETTAAPPQKEVEKQNNFNRR